MPIRFKVIESKIACNYFFKIHRTILIPDLFYSINETYRSFKSVTNLEYKYGKFRGGERLG